jgi:hypothetical protein
MSGLPCSISEPRYAEFIDLGPDNHATQQSRLAWVRLMEVQPDGSISKGQKWQKLGLPLDKSRTQTFYPVRGTEKHDASQLLPETEIISLAKMCGTGPEETRTSLKDYSLKKLTLKSGQFPPHTSTSTGTQRRWDDATAPTDQESGTLYEVKVHIAPPGR